MYHDMVIYQYIVASLTHIRVQLHTCLHTCTCTQTLTCASLLYVARILKGFIIATGYVSCVHGYSQTLWFVALHTVASYR